MSSVLAAKEPSAAGWLLMRMVSQSAVVSVALRLESRIARLSTSVEPPSCCR
jgi:hypothetical protein